MDRNRLHAARIEKICHEICVALGATERDASLRVMFSVNRLLERKFSQAEITGMQAIRKTGWMIQRRQQGVKMARAVSTVDNSKNLIPFTALLLFGLGFRRHLCR